MFKAGDIIRQKNTGEYLRVTDVDDNYLYTRDLDGSGRNTHYLWLAERLYEIVTLEDIREPDQVIQSTPAETTVTTGEPAVSTPNGLVDPGFYINEGQKPADLILISANAEKAVIETPAAAIPVAAERKIPWVWIGAGLLALAVLGRK